MKLIKQVDEGLEKANFFFIVQSPWSEISI